MVLGSKIVAVSYDILRGVNATIWGGVKEANKVGKIVKIGVSRADVVIGTSHALENLACDDKFCATIDIVESISSVIDLVLGNISTTKHLTFITGSVTVGCCTVKYYCKKHGTFWGCSVAAGHGIRKAIKFIV